MSFSNGYGHVGPSAYRGAVSSGCCNEELIEHLAGSLQCQGLAGSVVEFVGDGVQVGLCQVPEVGAALGEVLAQQPLVFSLEPRCQGLWGSAK